jgi:diguanylate cyclase (GGDEF)-like protein
MTIPKILVVDDTPANLLVMRKLLAKVDADLVEAESGSAALSACLDHEFALILLDVNMPEMDGFETASLIAEEEKNRLCPVIFVTAAYSDDVNRLKGYHAGAVDYIAKPINDQILRSKVQVFLELWSAKQQIRLVAKDLNERNHQLEHEISERRRAEAQVWHQAHHDPLTGLPNRVLFFDRLDTAIERADRNGSNFALLYIDIDGFKPVNDRHGHTTGDRLLQEIAQRLNNHVRRSDTVARLGGDEFSVILEVVKGPDEALHIGEQLCRQLAMPFSLNVQNAVTEVQVGGSIGFALYPLHGSNRETLLACADTAMYSAKRSGRNQCLMSAAT